MTESGAVHRPETRHLSKELVKRNGERTEVLRDIKIGIGAGEFVSIVGASGCGKTTLLRILDCLISPSPRGRSRAKQFPWRCAGSTAAEGGSTTGCSQSTS